MKKAGIGLLIVIAGIAIWYFGIKKEDYQVTFQVTGTPQGIYHHILKWNSWGASKEKNITNIDSSLFKEVRQKIALQDTTLQIEWRVEPLSDSITEVLVAVHSGEHSNANKLGVLAGETTFTKSVKRELKKFRSAVNSFGRSYRVSIDGIVEAPYFTYLYVTDTTQRNQKAVKMIAANVNVYPIIGEYRVEKDGFPFVKVKSWDIENDNIVFDFGFPIRKSTWSSDKKDSLRMTKRIKYGESTSYKALKATFYGNYSKSDQAWFALLNHAKENNIKLKNEPLEIFYNNPMQGGEDRNWKAEIFMPIID